MSLWKLRVGVENYYLAQVAHGLDDYYSGRGELPGRWVGAAVTGLGLGTEPVVASELRAVLAGMTPGTGLTPNGERVRAFKGRVPGFDLTFSVPKSVSVLYALGDETMVSSVVQAVDQAVDETVAWLERQACFVRRGSNNRTTANAASDEFGTRRLHGGGFVAAAFRHRTSRAGDPHLHTHVLVANMTCGPDGRWTALDAQGLYRCKHTAGAVFRSVLQTELSRRLGVAWRPGRAGIGEVAGIPDALVRVFSKRRAEIEAVMEADRVEGAAAAAEAMLRTRRVKEDIDPESLRQRWLDEAAELGYTPSLIDSIISPGWALQPGEALTINIVDDNGMVVERDIRNDLFASQVAEAMIGVDSTCTRHQIIEIVAGLLPNGASAACLERVTAWVLAQPELLPIPPAAGTLGEQTGWEQRWTTRRLAAIETDLINILDDPTVTGRIDPDMVDTVLAGLPGLGADQAGTVRQVALQGRGVEVIVGRAGTGKTYTMNTVRTVYQAAGYTLVGAAPSARAARELADGAGVETFTFPRFQRHAAPQLTNRHVVVVDEAGMAGTVDLHHVLTACRVAGAKVILVGDHRQLPEVAAGGFFAAAVERLGHQVAELTVNRRQTAVWEREALDQLRHGRVLEAFNSYQQHGHLTLAATTTELHTAAVDAWTRSHLSGRHAVLLAGTRAEARSLNLLARARLGDHLSGPVLELLGRQFQAGDRIVLLQNSDGHTDMDRRIGCRVDNGMIATITHINADDSVDIRLVNGRRIRLERRYVLGGNIDHGYATTIHKAQGLTCDEVFVVGPAGLYREAVYVAMSRARYGAYLFATSRQAAALSEASHASGIPLPSEHADELDHDLRTALATSKAKALAISHQPHIQQIANCADINRLDVLWDRHIQLRAITHHLVAEGHINPADAVARLERARAHRRFMARGGRVNAADWDNLGTIVAIFDRTGTCLVEFTSNDRGRTVHKTLEWADLRPVDRPDPVEFTPETDTYFALAEAAVGETISEWDLLLQGRGVDPDELHVVPAAIEMRRQRLAHALAGDPPEWLRFWYGPRPADHAGAQVWDDEIARLAAWRDARHIDPATPGYGPQPEQTSLAKRWEQHLDRSLTSRQWLHQHSPTLPPPAAAPVDIAAVRERLSELDQLLPTAPVDQTHIIEAITAGELSPTDIHLALVDAARTQGERREWILEHWPHVVEHAELTRIHHTHDALDHWPVPVDPAVQAILNELAATSRDTPEPLTIGELDEQMDAASPARQLAHVDAEYTRVSNQILELNTARNDADADQLAVIDTHILRLRQRRRELEQEWRKPNFAIGMWNAGGRPTDITDAINRRCNHLAHTAITHREPWVTTAVSQWHGVHPHGQIGDLRQMINDIGAYRERTNHQGPDALGPTPTEPALRAARQRLDHALYQAPTPQITDLLSL